MIKYELKNMLDCCLKVKKHRKRGIHKTKRNLQTNIREFFYPSIGFRAWTRYIFLSLNRKPSSSHSLALGFAIGAWISFTPFVGLHGIGSVALAYLFSASMVAALIGTLVGNPWTFPFIWHWILKSGNFILQRPISHEHVNLKLIVDNLFKHFSMDTFIDNILMLWDKLIFPMFIGGLPAGIIVGLFFYVLLKTNIDKFRAVRKAKIAKKKAERRAMRLTKIKKALPFKGAKKTMILGVGTDICNIKRINVTNAFAKRILSNQEQEIFKNKLDNPNFLAKRFAAKEAISKAFGTGIGKSLGFQDISILNNENGAPMVEISNIAKSKLPTFSHIHISISDEKEYALAFAIVEN